MTQSMRAAAIAAAAIALLASAPAVDHSAAASSGPFPSASTVTQPNGVVIATQFSAETALVDVQVFLPAGSAQQSADKAGVAAVTAAMVMQTPVERSDDLTTVAGRLGATVAYTIDPQSTRFSIECKATDLPRLLSDLAAALDKPDAGRFETARAAAMDAANNAIKDPALTAYAMIRQGTFGGTGYGRPDAGGPTSLTSLAPSDALAFAALYRHGSGTVVALSGNVTPDVLTAAKSAFSGFASSALAVTPVPNAPTRTREIVAHRDIAAPWVAVGYAVPSQFGDDFPTMLVIDTLLGHGGSIHAFAFGSDIASPDDFVGGYYQYEAQPGLLVEFFNGLNVDRDIHNLEDGVSRLRGGLLPADLLDRAKSATVGQFLTSVTTLDDQSWLLGRSALSPAGVGFENALPARIAAVKPADIQRVARKYLTTQTIAIVLPSGQ